MYFLNKLYYYKLQMIRNLIVIAFLAAAAADVIIHQAHQQSYNPPQQSYLAPRKCYAQTVVKTEVKTEIQEVSHQLKYEQSLALI